MLVGIQRGLMTVIVMEKSATILWGVYCGPGAVARVCVHEHFTDEATEA